MFAEFEPRAMTYLPLVLHKYFAGKDIAFYSMISDEWLDMKRKLEERLKV